MYGDREERKKIGEGLDENNRGSEEVERMKDFGEGRKMNKGA